MNIYKNKSKMTYLNYLLLIRKLEAIFENRKPINSSNCQYWAINEYDNKTDEFKKTIGELK